MKALTLIVSFSLMSFPAFADTYVKGYVKKDGTAVEGHYRSPPDGIRNNNYSTQGNVNPYNNREGTKQRDDSEGSYYLGLPQVPPMEKVYPKEKEAITLIEGGKKVVIIPQQTKETLVVNGKSYTLLYTLRGGLQLVYKNKEGGEVVLYYSFEDTINGIWFENETYYK